MKVRDLLLKALGHGDCVPRKERDRDAQFIRRQANEHQDQAREQYDRAERAEADNDRLREALRQIRDDPFVDRRAQMQARVALSADADADAEPCGFRFPDGRNCRERAGHTDEFHYHPDDSGVVAPYPSVEADAEPEQRTGVCGCGHYASQHGLGWKACAFCDCAQYAEPPRAEEEEN